MTLILGLLSIIQAIFLPGFLITGFFYPLKGTSRLLVSFALSLLFNYEFVFILTGLGLYGRLSVFILVALECVIWIRLRKRTPVSGIPKKEEFGRWQISGAKIMVPWRPGFVAVFGALSLIAAIGIAIKIFAANPGIFNSWDDVVSWNRWAADWYAGHMPVRTYHYPQLVPANWSMMYHFVGTADIQFFAKAIMGIFPVAILLMFYDLFKKLKSDFFLSACAWSGFVLFNILGRYIGNGYMDIPSAFFCFSIFYVLLLTVGGFLPVFGGLVLGSVLLAASLLVKQPGLYMLIPFAAACIFILSKAGRGAVNRKTLTIAMAGSYLLLVGPWFLYKEVQIRNNTDVSEVIYVTKDIYGGKGRRQRLHDASVKFRDAVTQNALIDALPDQEKPAATLLLFAVLIALSLLSLATSFGRFVLFFVGVPYYLIWAIYFSYDLRNSSLLVPYLGISLGVGSFVAINWLAARPRRSGQWAGLAIIALVILVCSIKFPENRLSAIERRMAIEQLMDSGMNRLLYQHYDTATSKRKALCAYPMMVYLPGLKQYAEPFSFNDETLDSLKTLLAGKRANYQFCILPDYAPPSVWGYFKSLDSLGYIKSKTRTNPGWNLIELNPNRQ
jgi:hypothetical protein